ncbi:non-functional NADPH-dependent codeinone reductase 2-like isoform X2 [Rhodamnia argentea]|uniref:Non-functional NADPH-dependent codeinone reductase 2-like isoform X2 n=1 Tax=Rhodamnia argentea TaxID=178133 RepID=A0A8B8R4N8_9MYRT|nr:non-functional NADPH-dependent codeinone reductase 2-like isoform X2 [Rhodamnia argentea]
MADVVIPETLLNASGKVIPLLGFGTAEFPFGSSDNVKEHLLHAIRLGYRHFDSASVYLSEQPLGEAVADALELGLISSREDLFITTKLWCSDAHGDRVVPALLRSLKNLRLEHVDLYLVHFPVSSKPGECEILAKEDLLPFDYEGVWKAMEECRKLGLAKSIGVSNFSCKKLEKLLSIAEIPPAVNQVEMNPLWQQQKLRQFCKEKGIHITAYSPLGAKGTLWGTNRVMECEVLQEIAKAKGKTLAQVCLRWVHEQGVSVLVKSFKTERMKENLDIFDWSLSLEDLNKIGQIPQKKGLLALEFVSPDGPYKSPEEFWDEEV